MRSLFQLLLLLVMSVAFFTPATASIPARTFSNSTFDALNRHSTLSEGSRTTSYGYDLNGNLLTKTLPNGEVVSQTYDGLNRLFAEKGISPQGPLYNHLSLCDAVGNLRFSSEMSASVPTRSMVLDYDNANRLTNERVYSSNNQLTSTTVHGYDNAYNRTSKTVGGVVTSYAYNTLNQLTGWTDTAGASASYTYDFNGNRQTRTTGGQTDTSGYDVENRLVSLTKNTTGGMGTYSYIYDYRTRRIARTENSATTNVVFSGGTSVQEYVSNSLMAEYIRGSDWGGGVGGILYSMRSGNPSFAHYNRRGDVTTRTDSTGVITYQASYQADGRRTAEFGSTLDRQKANTKEEDPTGLLNEGQRIRDLETLTFTTRDPMGFVDGPNLYSYVRCNPFSRFDPEGLAEEKLDNGTVVERDGHHVSPVSSWKDKDGKAKFSKDITDRLNGVRIGNEDVDHTFSSAHRSYNDRAKSITDKFIQDAEKAGLNPSGLSGKDAKEFADKLVKQLEGDKYIKQFNEMVADGRGTATALNAMRDAALVEGVLKESGVMSAVGKATRWMAHKGGVVAEHLPGALKVLGTGAAVAEFTTDAQAKGVNEAARTQYYRFSDIAGQTPEEFKQTQQSASNWLSNTLLGTSDEH